MARSPFIERSDSGSSSGPEAVSTPADRVVRRRSPRVPVPSTHEKDDDAVPTPSGNPDSGKSTLPSAHEVNGHAVPPHASSFSSKDADVNLMLDLADEAYQASASSNAASYRSASPSYSPSEPSSPSVASTTLDPNDPMTAVWNREIACGVLPDGSTPGYENDKVWEAMGTDAPWYSLEEILMLRQQCRERDPPDHWNIPISLIWKMLVTLLTDAHLLHTGSTAESTGPRDWQPILHNSIHPGNIWIERLPIDQGGPFGRCMLGRMTRCLILPRMADNDTFNDDERRDLRQQFRSLPLEYDSRYYEAPEIRSSTCVPTVSGSDVFSIGAVIMAMMMGANVFEAAAERIKTSIDHPRADVAALLDTLGDDPVGCLVGSGELSHALPFRFPAWLKSRVEQMLHPEPARRPCAGHLLDQVRVMAGAAGLEAVEQKWDRLTWMSRGLRMAK